MNIISLKCQSNLKSLVTKVRYELTSFDVGRYFSNQRIINTQVIKLIIITLAITKTTVVVKVRVQK